MSEQHTAREVDHIDFDDNRLVADLSGEFDSHLAILEDVLGVQIDPRGNRFAVRGPKTARERAMVALKTLYAKLERGEVFGVGEVRAAAKLTEGGETVTQVTTLPLSEYLDYYRRVAERNQLRVRIEHLAGRAD